MPARGGSGPRARPGFGRWMKTGVGGLDTPLTGTQKTHRSSSGPQQRPLEAAINVVAAEGRALDGLGDLTKGQVQGTARTRTLLGTGLALGRTGGLDS